ncbi:hypothetical protein [Streptomyces graminofaciens]|uniref:hypothetical protein n=1 Tax=Streptomyces graminofaciens TaxID=68212 RepID=UPI00257399CB|nr:hypothetical protein [Streptomyces graminofaciens]
MGQHDLNIDAGELRASAGAADALVTDLQPVLDKAINDLASAATAFKAWAVGPRMQGTGESWGSALGTLRDNLSEHGEGLRLLADGRDILEQDVIACFRGW